MYYTYVLFSLKDEKLYIGWTNDLKERTKKHSEGRVHSTKLRRPLKLIYYEACLSKQAAIRREKYFKTGFGRRFLKNRLTGSLARVAGGLASKNNKITKVNMKILITGGAGFIGSNIAKKLIDRGDEVVLIDNFNDYYNPQLKRDRIEKFLKGYDFQLYEGDIRDADFCEKMFKEEKIDKIIHLAAMAGVRNSLRDPLLYADVNVQGTTNLLNLAVKHEVKNFVFASSSSVYGNNKKLPFSEKDRVDTPISPYAATKRATELIAHVYHHIHGLNTTGLRFFTVYGPWGRPDMALFLFTKKILAGEPIDVYNHGKMSRNFTYVDDIASGTITVLDADLGYEIMNIGGDREEPLLRFIEVIEKNLGKEAKKNMMPIQPGDVPSTVADISKLRSLGWEPTTSIDEGIKKFVEWYKEYFGVK